MVKTEKVNPHTKVILEKVTINICVGNDKTGMQKAELLIKKITKDKVPCKCCAKRRLAAWQIRPGLPIGFKVTLRREEAKEFLGWIFASKGNKMNANSIDKYGNFALGVHEYLDLKGLKYDADIGIMGFEIMVTFIKAGYRIKNRLIKKTRVPNLQRVKKAEVINYLKENFKLEVKENDK